MHPLSSIDIIDSSKFCRLLFITTYYSPWQEFHSIKFFAHVVATYYFGTGRNCDRHSIKFLAHRYHHILLTPAGTVTVIPSSSLHIVIWQPNLDVRVLS